MESIVVTLYYILFAFSFIYCMYFAITGLFGFKNYHKSMFGRHKPKYKFAILVPSRNEEKVIGSLIKSLQKQRYPERLFDVYVMPNNCTDNTKEAALEAGANHLFIDVSLKGEQIVIKIADNGKGMPKQLISKIFEPFFTTKSNGTGLGLAVVQSVVSAHQGRLGLVSEENKGTCFSINLPLLKVALHEEPRMVA